MASPRALAVLAALTAALVIAVLVDVTRDPAPAPDAAPGRLLEACSDIARLVWQRASEPAVELVRQPDGSMVLASPAHAAGPADEAAVADILATLELLSYRRKLPADRHARGLADPRLRLTITCERGQTVTLALGQHIAAIDRVWLARERSAAAAADDDAATDYLIEGYVARALDRPVHGLRSRRLFPLLARAGADPFAGPVASIELRHGGRTLVLSGKPPMVQLDASSGLSGSVRADPVAARELAVQLRDLALARFVASEAGAQPPPPMPPTIDPQALHVRITGKQAPAQASPGAAPAQALVQELVVLGPCPDDPGMRLVATVVGTGCVGAAVLDAIAAQIHAPPAPMVSMVSWHLVDPGAALTEIRVRAGSEPALTLVARGNAWLLVTEQNDSRVEEPAEASAVLDWLAALTQVAAPGELVPVATTEPGNRVLDLTFVYAGGYEERIALFAAQTRDTWLARRNDEPAYLVFGPVPGPASHASRILPAGPQRFRQRQLLSLEPYGLREVVARRGTRITEHLVRGELLDEWRVVVPASGTLRPGVIEPLRETAAHLRARRFLADPASPAHGLDPARRHVELVFDPGPLDPDAPVRHGLDLGASMGDGCAARLDRAPAVFELDRASCDLLLGPWTTAVP